MSRFDSLEFSRAILAPFQDIYATHEINCTNEEDEVFEREFESIKYSFGLVWIYLRIANDYLLYFQINMYMP